MNGIDISNQRSRRFVAEDFEGLIRFMHGEDVIDDIRRIAKKKFDATKVDLLMNELYPGKNIDVPDPW